MSMPEATAPPGNAPQVVCIGESMVLLTAPPGETLDDADALYLFVAGAESNVALGLAHLGHTVEWLGRVGDDPLGKRVRRALSDGGVQTVNAIVDDTRPTGVYFKSHFEGRSRVYYYRARSAASTLSRSDLDALRPDDLRLCHVSGITAALSPACDDLLQAIVVDRALPGVAVSFDVNYRPALWDSALAAPRLLELARHSDIVIVGRDEADHLWATGDAHGVRRLLPDVSTLVVKDSDIGATLFDASGETHVPALSIDVVEPVGAGDAFAAGFLSSWLSGDDPATQLRTGHVMAGFALQAVSDLPALPPLSALREYSAVGPEHWSSLRLPVPQPTGSQTGRGRQAV